MSAFTDAANAELDRADRLEKATGNRVASSNIRATLKALSDAYAADMAQLQKLMAEIVEGIE